VGEEGRKKAIAMKCLKPVSAAALAAVALAGCVPTQMGPTIMAMPAPGKPFETFAQEQDFCRGYANTQVAPARDEANNWGVGAAALTTLLGAGLGAALGGGSGAAIGAASGALGGSAIGANNSMYAVGPIQHQYDNFYAQCMYAKGNQVAGFAAPVPNTPTVTPSGAAPLASSAPLPGNGTITPVPVR